ncbi:MAG: hypothetical protein Ct9H300mP18_13980 [Candidatus Neomarinimicrobiota bacterium]|nr:MAG: hypothetical protein Ct9H300mP18_13980 [Candidatus Neomarinimicrobiota bacterium]
MNHYHNQKVKFSYSHDEYFKWRCHADNNLDIQEYMIFPIGADTFSDSFPNGDRNILSFKKNFLKGRKNLLQLRG